MNDSTTPPRTPNSDDADSSHDSSKWSLIHQVRTHETILDNIMITLGRTETAHSVLEEKIDRLHESVEHIRHFLYQASKKPHA